MPSTTHWAAVYTNRLSHRGFSRLRWHHTQVNPGWGRNSRERQVSATHLTMFPACRRMNSLHSWRARSFPLLLGEEVWTMCSGRPFVPGRTSQHIQMIRGCSTPEKTLPSWSCWWQRNIPCEQQVPNSLQDFFYKYPRLPWVNSKSSSVTGEAKCYRTLEEHLAPFNREGLSTWSKTCFTFSLLGLWSPSWRCCKRGGQHLTKMGSHSFGGMQLARLGSQHQARGSAALQQRTEGRRAIYLPHHHTYTLEKTFGQKISWGLPENDIFLFEEQTTSV